METLQEYALRFGTDKAVGGPGSHHYTPVYEEFFAGRRDQPVELLEIGTQEGGSLLMWEAWFPSGQITGLDIDPINVINTERVRTIVGDFRDYLPDRTFDIVIDDGSHLDGDIFAARELLLPFLASNGAYVVEDLQRDSAVTRLPHRWLAPELCLLT